MIINFPQSTNYCIVFIIVSLVFDWMIQCIDGGTSILQGSILTDHIHYSPVTNEDGGVPIDINNFNANSSFPDASTIPSAPGCPKPEQGLPWIYFGQQPKCYLVGTRGPCLSGHLFFGNGTLAPWWGHCNCPCLPLKSSTSEKSDGFFHFDVHVTEFPNYLLCKIKDVPELSHVQAVYDKQTEMCYFLNTQGPCQTEEWVVWLENGIEETGNIACVPKCTSDTEAVGPFHSSYIFDSPDKICKINPSASAIQPVSLTASLGQQGCSREDGMIYSKTLKKCIPKSKAFFIKFI